jgi:RNA polymerase sigma factor (sigma-70 family)
LKNPQFLCNKRPAPYANHDKQRRTTTLTNWNQIREIHGPMVWSTVARILKHRDDAIDCFQDVFAEAIQRGRRSPVDDWGALLRWLATRRAIDQLRRRQRNAAASSNLEQVCDSAQSVEENVRFEELVQRVRSEMAKMPDRQAEAFWLVCVEERTYEEVAQQMGVRRNAVGVLVHRARIHLRSQLQSVKAVSPEHDGGAL